MQSLILIDDLNSKLIEEGYNSYNDLEKLKSENLLDKMIETLHIDKLLKIELIKYLDFLFDDSFKYRYLKKMLLEQITYSKLTYNVSYILSLYSNNKYAYRNLPILLKSLIDKLDITEYKYVSLEDITYHVYKNYDISDIYNPNINQNMCEINYKIKNDKYDQYDSSYDYNSVNAYNAEEFSIWAEHRVYDDEYNNLKNNDYTKWVAREYGDGYGFDVLTIDLNKNKEKLIEVKSGKYENFSLTDNECKVMRNCHFKNADYYIYKYTFYESDNSIDLNIYKYEPSLDILIDKDNNYYSLKEYQEYTEFGNLINKYSINKINLEKQKTI